MLRPRGWDAHLSIERKVLATIKARNTRLAKEVSRIIGATGMIVTIGMLLTNGRAFAAAVDDAARELHHSFTLDGGRAWAMVSEWGE